ncbi:MAG: HD domain-containing phosphohydrolase [Candidatus Omnitrophota bacterium]
MKNQIKKSYYKEKRLIVRIGAVFDLKKVKAAFSKYLGSFSLWLIYKKTCDREKIKHELCKTAKSSERNEKACLDGIEGVVRKAGKSKKIETFECAIKRHGFCFPLVYEGEAFGYIIACQMRNHPDSETLELFSYLIETGLRGIKNEIELEELYKTVKPRAVALSTVHTIHRLITSSLYLDELLSRIARLSMQIIRANRCSIKLIDSKKKTLLPKATVDLRTEKAKLKKVKIGRWAPGKAVKYGKSIRGDRYLATPLIDEDIIGVITLYDKIGKQPFNHSDVEIMRTLAEQAAIAIKNAQLYKEQEKLTMGSIKALAQIIESKGTGIYTPKSSFLRIVQLIGQEFEMREHELKTLQYATLLHDAGELMVPEEVLKKKGKLTDREYKLIKEHPLKGAKIIKSLKSLKSITPIIMYHHESYDGAGYPKGLKGGEIPLGARIMAVVAAFEAMITKRPYRVRLSIGKAIEEIKKNSRIQFDPKVVKAFLKVVGRKDIVNLIKREIYGAR